MDDQLEQGRGNETGHVSGAGVGVRRIRGGSLVAEAPTSGATAIGGPSALEVVALARRVLAFGPPQVAWSSEAPEEPRSGGARAGTPPRGTPAVAPVIAPTATAAFLTVEQYAALCVDLERSPLDAAAVLRRHGIAPEHRRALDEDWAQLFAGQPARRATFERAKRAYRTWLAQSGRR